MTIWAFRAKALICVFLHLCFALATFRCCILCLCT